MSRKNKITPNVKPSSKAKGTSQNSIAVEENLEQEAARILDQSAEKSMESLAIGFQDNADSQTLIEDAARVITPNADKNVTLEMTAVNRIEPRVMGTNESDSDAEQDDSASLDEIIKKHQRNMLENQQSSSAKEFMAKVKTEINLTQLYQVIASPQFRANSDFCPVLLKIMDQEMVKANHGKEYLLQVWDKKGQMMYERALNKPCSNWGISYDSFVFQEDSSLPEVFVVDFRVDMAPMVYKFILPAHLFENKATIEFIQGVFKLPDEKNLRKTADPKHQENSENCARATREYDSGNYVNINERFTQQIITRDPDKMVDILDNHLVLALPQELIFANLDQYIVKDPAKRKQSDQVTVDGNVVTVRLGDEEIKVVEIADNFKIISIQDITNLTSALVLENLHSRQLKFYQIVFNEKNKMSLENFGGHRGQSAKGRNYSPMLKFRSVAKTDEATGMSYQISIALRVNGAFEVFSDFNLANSYFDPSYQCIDIATSYAQFYLRFSKVNKGEPEKSFSEYLTQFEIRQIRHSWRNQTAMNTSKVVPWIKWTRAIHKRVADHMNLITSVTNFDTLMIVAHRNILTIQEMKMDREEENIEYKNIFFDQGNIREMVIKKRSKEDRLALLERKNQKAKAKRQAANKTELPIFEKYEVLSLIGTHTIVATQFDKRGDVKKNIEISCPERILSIKDDSKNQMGVTLLTDGISKLPDYIVQEGHSLFTFPYSRDDSKARTKIQIFNQGKFFELISSDQLASVQFDSYFDVLKVNASYFKESLDEDKKSEEEDEEDPLKPYYKYGNTIRVLFVSSVSNGQQIIHPLVKEKDERGVIKNMVLLTQHKFKEDDQGIKEVPKATFPLRSPDFGEYMDSIVVVCYNSLKIYDKNFNAKLEIKGLNIRASFDVHQKYLYMINDLITESWTVIDSEGEETKEENQILDQSGFYVLDLQRLVKGKVDKYKLLNSVGGYANNIDRSIFADRFSIVQAFDQLTVVPFPQLNLIGCVGMRQKSEYLIWREKNGFFSALTDQNILTTWSLINGGNLYSEKCEAADDMTDYEVYRADDDDVTYTRDFYNLKHESITLLMNKYQFNFNSDETAYSSSLGRNIDDLLERHDASQNEQVFKFKSEDHPEVIHKESTTEANLHHFRVLSLRTHEDTQLGSVCKLKFQFLFEKITTLGQMAKIFEWGELDDPVQNLYLSRDTMFLMEVINNFIATVYYRENVDKPENSEDSGQVVKWISLYRIKSYPRSLLTETSVPFLFSPNFKHQLDFDFSKKTFEIRDTRSQAVILTIPEDLMNIDWGQISGQDAIKIWTSRFSWVDDYTFRIINEADLDCIFEIKQAQQNDPTDPQKKVLVSYIEMISIVRVDNMTGNELKQDDPHFLLHQKPVASRDVLKRLSRLNQRYKSNLQHAINLKQKDFNMLSQIFSVDYQQPWLDQQSHFDVQLTYTWLDWFIMEQVMKEGDFNLKNIDEYQQIQLCFNILPKGRTVLHQLALGGQSQKEEGSASQNQAYNATEELFDVCSSDNIVDGDDEIIQYQMPVLRDMYGFTALDFCLGTDKLDFVDLDIFHSYDDAVKVGREKEFTKSENLSMAILVFERISKYSFMHSSFEVNESLLEAIRIALPGIGDYLESLFKDADHVFQIKTQRAIKPDKIRNSAAYGDYASINMTSWAAKKQITDELFEKQGPQVPMNLSYLDLPFAYTHTPIGFRLVDVLVECPNLDLFGLASVQVIIDNQSKHWNKINYGAVGLPIAAQLFLFWYWGNVILTNIKADGSHDSSFEDQNDVCRVFLIILSVYLATIELSALYYRGLDFFKSMTKMVNLIVPLLILFQVFSEDVGEVFFWELQTWTALFQWTRFLLFLRSVQTFSYLIRMITASIFDMATFMIVLVIGVLAFADAFLSIEQILLLKGTDVQVYQIPEDPSTYEQYFAAYVFAWQKSYATALGEFDGNLEFYREVDWFVWFLCTIFNLVLLFNLLIAIISKTFEEIDGTAQQTGYKEKVIQIQNIQDSLLGYFKDTTNPTKLIFLAREAAIEKIEEDSTKDSLNELKEMVESMQDKIIEETQDFISKLLSKKELEE